MKEKDTRAPWEIKAEKLEDKIGDNIGSILYVIASVIWAVILIALFTNSD